MKMKVGALGAALCALLALPAAAQSVGQDLRVLHSCSWDVLRLCGGTLPGEGRIRACMRENMSQISAGCVDAMLTAAAAARETTNTRPIPIPASPADMTYNGLRGVIYCEVWLFRHTPEGQIAGVYYNTSALNNAADPMNTCPAAMWDRVTVPSLQAQFDVLAAYRNGPRGWTMDSITIPVGPVVAFDGLETRWMGEGRLPQGVSLAAAHMQPYSPLQSHRRSSFTFRAGQPVFILDDLQGTPWVMQAYGQLVDTTLTYATLPSLAQKLRPPPGWRFRVQVIDRDLTVSTPQGYNWIVQDELQNTYDACKEGACTFQP
jgi:hypothetical protein